MYAFMLEHPHHFVKKTKKQTKKRKTKNASSYRHNFDTPEDKETRFYIKILD
jgi:hypothetical protein